MQGLLILKGFTLKTLKKIKGYFCAQKSKKEISIVIKNVIGSKDTLMRKAECPSNYFSNSFTHNQTEQIKNGLICVQILLEIHLIVTVDFIFKVGQLHLHTSLGHSNVVFVL